LRRFCQLGLVLTLLGLLPAVPVGRAEAKVGKSVVVGGIRPCSGLPPRMVKNLPDYVAGTVFVLKGRMIRTKQGGLSFPKQVVTRQTVGVNATYRFALFPGHYVLTAHLPHSNVRPFVQITVREGITTHADVPNMCR
jgi:hypothetical protein